MEQKSYIFLTAVNSKEDTYAVKVLIRSLRRFGGEYRSIPIYIYTSLDQQQLDIESNATEKVIPYKLEEPFHSYPFAYKVIAISDISNRIKIIPDRIIWLDPSSMILKPPELFNIKNDYLIGIRPVHIKNVGIEIEEEINDYWKAIYSLLTMDHSKLPSMRTYVDKKVILPYFNCGIYVIDSNNEMLKFWWDTFEKLVEDAFFQNNICKGNIQRIFLHQCIFSALICKYIPYERIRIFPPEYGYPLHFHERLSQSHEEIRINDVVVMLGYNEDLSETMKTLVSSFLRESENMNIQGGVNTASMPMSIG